MTQTAVCGTFEEPPDQGCWCCGDSTVRASLLRLHGHPEVGVCFRCIGDLMQQRRAIQRATRAAPPGPWWRRVQYRAGFGHC